MDNQGIYIKKLYFLGVIYLTILSSESPLALMTWSGFSLRLQLWMRVSSRSSNSVLPLGTVSTQKEKINTNLNFNSSFFFQANFQKNTLSFRDDNLFALHELVRRSFKAFHSVDKPSVSQCQMLLERHYVLWKMTIILGKWIKKQNEKRQQHLLTFLRIFFSLTFIDILRENEMSIRMWLQSIELIIFLNYSSSFCIWFHCRRRVIAQESCLHVHLPNKIG